MHEDYSDNEEQNMSSCKELELDKDNEVSFRYNLIHFQFRFHLNRNHCDGFHWQKGTQRISVWMCLIRLQSSLNKLSLNRFLI